MIKITTLIALIIFVSATIGQAQSTDFPDQAAKWNYLCYEPSDIISYSNFEMSGDSVYNNLQYQKINNEGLVRTDEQKVYFIPDNTTDEILLYDFTLEVGDTFFIAEYHQNEYDYIIVDEIEEQTTQDGVLRKVFRFSDGNTWIEGIGATQGSVTFPWYFVSLSGVCDLLCFSNQDEFVISDTIEYISDNYDMVLYSCNGILTSTEDRFEDIKIELFPNPVVDQLIITADNAQINQYKILNSHGQLILFQKDLYTQSLQLDDLNWSAGFYFVQVQNSKASYTFKIFKK